MVLYNKQLLDDVKRKCHFLLTMLSMMSWIIKTEVCVISRSRRLRQPITQTRGFDNLWYHEKTEFNNSFIIHFSHNSSSETEAKRSAICFWGEHSKELSDQADVELDMINAISAADIAFIMSSSQAIVNWLNALDQSDFSQWVWCIIIKIKLYVRFSSF